MTRELLREVRPQRRPGRGQSGRLYEIPLLFAGSTMLFAIFYPGALKSQHGWLPWIVLGLYAAVLLFLFWFLRGWGRIVATLAIVTEIAAWRWIPAQLQGPLVLAAPALFLGGWAMDFWMARRAVARASQSKG